MTSADRLRDWLLLAHAPGIGPRTVSRLMERFDGPRSVLEADTAELRAAGARAGAAACLRSPPTEAADASLAWAEEDDAHILTREDPLYPPLLKELTDAPVILYVRGDPELLADPQLAIVGSRNPTPACQDTTRAFSSHLAACGLTITSGLAIGVDGAAHEGALEGGRTIAVLGTGPDRVYPAAHRDLARNISRRGALVTELPPGAGPKGDNFPRRNRIISGLSLGVLVTEAALRSGSLITARCAMEQGREVFAIPGSIHNPLARGCHSLIKDGAKLVETAQDVLEELAALLGPFAETRKAPVAKTAGEKDGLDPDYRNLLEAMGHDPVDPDELTRRTNLPAQSVSSMLLLLELEGYVSSYPGGRYCRTAGSS